MKRNLVIDNLRGLAMLGVIGIHIGSFVLSSATPRLDLFLLLQVFTRFAVPAFFFISGYGLFCGNALEKPFHYWEFMKKHLITVGLPYLTWSLFYIALWQSEDMIRPDGSFSLSVLLVKLLLGEGCYHIYFLIILLGFYFTLPFWRGLVKWLQQKTAAGLAVSLAVLAGLQLWLYHWNAVYWVYPAWTAGHPFILRLLNERVNYIPLFYGFVFILGGLYALYEQTMRRWLQNHLPLCCSILFASCAVLLWRFRAYMLQGKELEQIPEYLTQLTPEGLLYTVCWLLCFCALLEKLQEKGARLTALKVLSSYSMVIYLIHPFFLNLWYDLFGKLGFTYAQVPVLLYYLLVLCTSLLAGVLIHGLALHSKPLGLLLLGRQPR